MYLFSLLWDTVEKLAVLASFGVVVVCNNSCAMGICRAAVVSCQEIWMGSAKKLGVLAFDYPPGKIFSFPIFCPHHSPLFFSFFLFFQWLGAAWRLSPRFVFAMQCQDATLRPYISGRYTSPLRVRSPTNGPFEDKDWSFRSSPTNGSNEAELVTKIAFA